MKEAFSPNPENEGVKQASFFKIDPENWPDLPPPIIKPKRRRNPYRLLGVARLTDPPPAERLAATAPAINWGPSKLLPPPGSPAKIAELKVRKQAIEEKEKIRQQIRTQGFELIRKFKAGEVGLDDARDFYQNNATDLIPEKTYEAYKVYAAKNNREVMSWSDYAKRLVLELFTADLISQGFFFIYTSRVKRY